MKSPVPEEQITSTLEQDSILWVSQWRNAFGIPPRETPSARQPLPLLFCFPRWGNFVGKPPVATWHVAARGEEQGWLALCTGGGGVAGGCSPGWVSCYLPQTHRNTDFLFLCLLTTWVCSSGNSLLYHFPLGPFVFLFPMRRSYSSIFYISVCIIYLSFGLHTYPQYNNCVYGIFI